MIANDTISEIGKFGSTELKIDIKQAYNLIKQESVGGGMAENTKKSNETVKENETQTPRKGEKEVSTGLENLNFLTHLHSVMSKSLPRIYLYNLRNFDKSLFINLKGLILDENDNDDLT